MDYFYIVGPDDPLLATVLAEDTEELKQRTISRLAIESEPLRLKASAGRLVDYPPTNFLDFLTLCSPQMKDVLQEFSQLFEWLEVQVETVEGEIQKYYGLLPREAPDVLNEDRTVRDRRTNDVIKPILSKSKASGLHLFLPVRGGASPVCSEQVRRKLEWSGVSGVEFKRMVSD